MLEHFRYVSLQDKLIEPQRRRDAKSLVNAYVEFLCALATLRFILSQRCCEDYFFSSYQEGLQHHRKKLYLVRMMRTVFLIACLIGVAGQLPAQQGKVNSSAKSNDNIVMVDDGIVERNFMPYELMYYADTTNSLSFAQVSSIDFFEQFKKHPEYQNKDFKTDASYWIRLAIHHNQSTKKVWLLEFYDQTIDQLQAFIPQEEGNYKLVVMGDSKLFPDRIIPHKNFEIPLVMKSDTVMYYYFNVRSHDFADIRIAFRSVDRFIHYALNEYFLFGTFYGMILIISLYNFLVFLAIREIKNIYYIIYILSVAAYAMSYDGIGFQYLWPNHPEWNNYATGFTLYSVIVWGLIFTRRFLAYPCYSSAPGQAIEMDHHRKVNLLCD